MRLSLNLLSV